MPTVELVLTEARVWARSANTHADLPASVTPGSDGTTLVAGEPLRPSSVTTSATQLLVADRIAYAPNMPKPVDAMDALFARLLADLRIPTPCGQLSLVCPTEWGSRRRTMVAAAGRRYASDVVCTHTAVRAVIAGERNRDRRTVVVEFGLLSTTASSVVPTHDGLQVEACEHEPDLALAELVADGPAHTKLHSVLDRLLDGRSADSVLLVGAGSDPGLHELLGTTVSQVCGPAMELRALPGADLAHNKQNEARDHQPTLAELPRNEWVQPLRDRAARASQPRSRTPLYLGAAAVVVVLLATSAGIAVLNSGGDDSGATAAVPESSAAPQPEVQQPSSTSGAHAPTEQTVDHLRFQVPRGWRISAPTEAGNRVELVPEHGPPAKITVTQRQVDPDVGYQQIAADLDAQIAQRPAGSVSELGRDVVFGGRSGLAYTEHPEDGSQVDWHVIVEHSTQVSMGCQYQAGGHDSIRHVCADFATTLAVTP